jgi:hypothetical protein
MDSTLIITLGLSRVNFDISDFNGEDEIIAALKEVFPGDNTDDIEVDDMADFPESMFNLPAADMWERLYQFYLAACTIEVDGSDLDAFKAFYENEGSADPRNLLNDFKNRYAGDFQEPYDFGVYCAEACGMNLAGNESFFMYEGFGESCAIDYEVLEDRYYFRR